MKSFEIVEMELGAKVLVTTLPDKRKSYTTVGSGSRQWTEYLRYTAWVEAGNNPEDFWTQDEALLTEGEEE